MTFTPLESRLGTLPLVLCGPVLRRVTPSSVTVWIVTREEAIVTLTVYDSDRTRPGCTGIQLLPPPPNITQRRTTPIGKYLHMVALTARGPDGTLKENQVYCYNMAFKFAASGAKKLNEATLTSAALTEFAYEPYKLPSFVLPPSNLEKLRIIHGSCRKPNGNGADMLAILDDLIAANADQPLSRPHQLFMTGDQIYADEVADVLLLLLTDAGDVLLGWREHISSDIGPLLAKGLPPRGRSDIIKAAHFTTMDNRSHLMFLGEYLAMYLFAWSPVLWPTDLHDLPLPMDIPGVPPIPLESERKELEQVAKIYDDIMTQRSNVVRYASTIWRVRRALANIPSYMICDDHEITDDWNMTREFCDGVYGNPVGMRVVQNGLVAYALCQGWGNTPEQFEDDPRNPAGRRLLRYLAGGDDISYLANSENIQRILGLHDATKLAKTDPYGLYHEGGSDIVVQGVHVNDASLNFHYSVEGPSHQVIVTDTRTWRKWPKEGKVEHPDLLSSDDIIYQIGHSPSLGNRLQLVVVTTNMPPIPGVRWVEKNLPFHPKGFVYEKDLYDSWKFPSSSFDLLVTKLSDRLPLVTSKPPASKPPARSGRVIILSGDVHSSYASRLGYWADKRYGDDVGISQAAKVVFAQLVASSFKNESEPTLGQHERGYKYAPPVAQIPGTAKAVSLLLPPTKEGVFGWAVDPLGSQQLQVGEQERTMDTVTGPIEVTTPLVVSWVDPSRSFDKLEGYQFLEGVLALKWDYVTSTITTPADYQYRSEQILASALGQSPKISPQLPPVGPAETLAIRKAALAAYTAAAGAYRDYKNTAGRGSAIVGRNNICEITFTWGEDDNKQVHQTVRWFEKDASTMFWARYSVSLALNDTVHYGPLPFPPRP